MKISTAIYELGAYVFLNKLINNERTVNIINTGGTAHERPFNQRMFVRFLGGIKWMFRTKIKCRYYPRSFK